MEEEKPEKEKTKPLSELIEFSLINIDKPAGPTSFGADTIIKKLFNKYNLKVQKAAHLGTLDPMVTGVLPMELNRACRLTPFLMRKNKTYKGILHIHKELTQEQLQEDINKHFLGKIMQLPPKKSRVKRQERQREIFTFTILAQSEKEKKDFSFETEVEAGTYIRKLIHDLGESLGTGAHMKELRRTKAGIFSESTLNTIPQLEKALEEYKNGNDKKLREMLIPGEAIIKQILPQLQANPDSTGMLLQGKPLMKSDLKTNQELPPEFFSLWDKTKLLGIYKTTNEGKILARPQFVNS